MAGIYSQGGSAGHRYAGWLSEVEAKNFQFGGKVFNGSPSAIYVGSNLVWPWLTEATKQAIVGAFGQRDGMAVINATNAYLNGIASTDKAKATALAALINEDPMMVCSLGLEPQGVTMPIRWIDNNRSAYFNTGLNLFSKSEFSFKLNYIPKSFYNYNSIWGSTLDADTFEGWVYSDGRLASRYNGSRPSDRTVTLNTAFSLECKLEGGKWYVVLNGTALSSTPTLRIVNANLLLFISGGDYGNGIVDALEVNYEGAHRFIPFKRNGNIEILDIETGNLATRVGTFTEKFYLPDGTPWTPSTP